MSAAPTTYVSAANTTVLLSLLEQAIDGVGNTFSAGVNNSNDSLQSYSNGTGNAQLRRIHEERVTLTPASGTYDLDLTTILDPFGVVCNTSKIKFIYIKNRAAATGGQLLVGAAVSNPWIALFANSGAPTTVKETIDAGGEFFRSSPNTGFTVSAGSKTLRFTHNGGSSTSIVFDVVIGLI